MATIFGTTAASFSGAYTAPEEHGFLWDVGVWWFGDSSLAKADTEWFEWVSPGNFFDTLRIVGEEGLGLFGYDVDQKAYNPFSGEFDPFGTNGDATQALDDAGANPFDVDQYTDASNFAGF